MAEKQFIITKSGNERVATVVIKNVPHSVPSSEPYFDKVLDLLRDPEATMDQVEAVIFAKVRSVEAAIFDDADFRVAAGVVTYKDLTLPLALSDHLLSMAQEGFDLGPLKKFVENLVQNPSYRVFQQLYAFMERGKMALTPDGCFLAYKKVRPDWLDIHSASFSNEVGNELEMARLKVDDDPENVCSSGLHVCSFDYLDNFGGPVEAGYHVVVCKVNPRDVVSVPKDYGHAKMRVCRYEVVSEVDSYVSAGKNVLASASVSSGSSFETFVVETLGDDGAWEGAGSFDLLSDAFSRFADIQDDIVAENRDELGVRVVNCLTGGVLESWKN